MKKNNVIRMPECFSEMRYRNRWSRALLLGGAAWLVSGMAIAAEVSVKTAGISVAEVQTSGNDGNAVKSADAADKDTATKKAKRKDSDAANKSGGLKENNAGNRSGNPTGGASSLMVAPGSSPLTNSIRVRGIGASVSSISAEQDVQAAVDGIVLIRGVERTMSSFADYPDIASGVALYGPQGTMFSKNAIGGAVNIVTLAPTQEFSGSAQIGIGEAGEYHEKGTVSGAISDSVSVRVSAFNNNVPGNIHNKGTGKDDNASNSYGANTKVLWNVNSRLDITLSAWYRNDSTTCCKSVPVKITSPLLAEIYSSNPIVLTSNMTLKDNKYDETNGGDFRAQTMIFALRADYDLGNAKLTSITAFQNRRVNQNMDLDSMYNTVPIYTGGSSGNYYADANTYPLRLSMQQWSQDFRLESSDADSALRYVAGLYMYHLDISQKTANRYAYCSQGTVGEACDDQYISWKSRGVYDTESNNAIAIYGELQYSITGHLMAFGGPRIQYETIRMAGYCHMPETNPDNVWTFSTDTDFGYCYSGTTHGSDLSVSGDAGLRYDFGMGTVYGKATRGYKGLATNNSAKMDYANQEVVKPETSYAYEIGLTLHTPDNKYLFNVTLFQTNYENMQVSATRANVVTGYSDTIVTNAGTARSRGFELSLIEKPFGGFSLSESVAFTEAVFNLVGNSCAISKQYGVTATYDSMEEAPANTCYMLTGDTTLYSNTIKGQMPNSPKWKISVTPRYQFGIPDTHYNAFVLMNVNYTTKTMFSLDQDPDLFQKAYTLVNASVGVSDKDGRYSVTFNVTNLTNQLFYTSMSHITLTQTKTNYDNYSAMIPRMASRLFSVRLATNF